METKMKNADKLGQSITLKAVVIGILTLLMLIPGVIIQDLIREREMRSDETIEKINANWSNAQTIAGPVLCIPYTENYLDEKKMKFTETHILTITPELLIIKSELFPKEKHYGIYKTILYKSELNFEGNFPLIDLQDSKYSNLKWDEAYITLGISDLRGVSNNMDFEFGNKHYTVEASGDKKNAIGQGLIVKNNLNDIMAKDSVLKFKCQLQLKGSSSINFIPIGKTTHITVAGAWQAPGFVGSFSPEYNINKNGFNAKWDILHFNRSIPETWIDDKVDSVYDTSFGVNLVDTVNHYQQNMRSAKYALMFIALTFVIFFFVEVITKKRIHPVQYLLVGIALILFYSLLLSISEQINFGWAYLIASLATIGLISSYAHSIFKNKTQTAILGIFLIVLYVFLYIVLQLEDVALLIGSIGLFIILGIIMYFSKKISWYKQDEIE